ncbi:MAG: carboxymuconolactone decarboxylase family protein [Chloroflexota bacterium]
MPHLDPLPRDALPQYEELFERYDRIRGFLPNSILTMGRRPKIADAFMQLNQAILYEGTVPEQLKMMIALVTSAASGCLYCQSHMANLSSVYGAEDEKIQAVWEYETSPLFSEAERATLRLAFHAALVPNAVTAEHFDEVKKHFTDTEIVEIVASISLFGYLNRWNDTIATELEAYPSKVADRAIGAVGWNPGKHGKN